jgi:hypothetical protein
MFSPSIRSRIQRYPRVPRSQARVKMCQTLVRRVTRVRVEKI